MCLLHKSFLNTNNLDTLIMFWSGLKNHRTKCHSGICIINGKILGIRLVRRQESELKFRGAIGVNRHLVQYI